MKLIFSYSESLQLIKVLTQKLLNEFESTILRDKYKSLNNNAIYIINNLL
jgi:hypothetical protein